jgi:hypothetical protein
MIGRIQTAWGRALIVCLVLCPYLCNDTASPAASAAIRKPRGIYAVNGMDEILAGKASDFDALLSNPAVSGLTVRLFWSDLQPAKAQYDFSRLEEAFTIASSKNKTIQLMLLPGFGTPRWVLDELPSCDGFLSTNGPISSEAAKCGKATFEISEGRYKGQKRELPLPWNATYKGYWRTFLREFAARFGQRDTLVSISVAGPTAISDEMILPHTGAGELKRWERLLRAFYRDPSYQRSTKAFVEEWKAAIDDYGRIFSNVTLVLTYAQGFPFNFPANTAQGELASYFSSHPLGTNSKATQTSGLKACRAEGLGLRNLKQLSADATLSPRVLAGAQFGTSFSRFPQREGCPGSCDGTAPACRSITPDEALSNALAVYFDGTPAGHFFGAADGAAPLNYLQIYAEDIRYANAHPSIQAKLMEVSKRLLGLAE